jgi:hypothetical protein
MQRIRPMSHAFFWGGFVLLLVCALVNQAGSQTSIQSFDTTRSACSGTGSFVAGGRYVDARTDLQPSGYSFGTGVSAITPQALGGVDIFVIGALTSPLSSQELCMLDTFVNHGGAVLDFRNDPQILGVVPTGNSNATGSADFLNSTDPNVQMISAGVSGVFVGANSTLTIDSSSGAIPFLHDLVSPSPIGLVLPPITGRLGSAIIIGDEEIFMNDSPVSCAAGFNEWVNEQLLLNIFAYLSTAPGLNTSGPAAIQACASPTYTFTGFFQPVDTFPTLNVAKAGSAIPVKFSLHGDQGLDIMAAASPASQPIPCDSTALVDPIEQTVTAAGSSLTYDPTVDQYIYVWKTNKEWAGTCRQLVVTLKDGNAHRANFKLTK